MTPAAAARTSAAILALGLALGAAALAQDAPPPSQVELRGGQTVGAPVESVDWEGVHVGGAAPRIISWDRVKRVTGPRAGEADAFIREIADPAWRARARLERGDAAMAEPLFEALFDRYRAQPGPTAAVVADGLLRCRLHRAAQTLAIEPWLEWLRLRATGDAEEDALGSPVDAEWLLAPALSPIFLPDDATAALAETIVPERMREVGGAPESLAWWYLEAARAAIGRPASSPADRPRAVDHPGVVLVESIVLAIHGQPAERKRARDALIAGLPRDRGTWREAWRRVALGFSLMQEQDPEARAQGEIEALHAPARFASSQPYLAGVALARVALARRAAGHDAEAEVLRNQLLRLEPNHPALRWLDSQRVPRAPGASGAPAPTERTP